jgi:hypothetical protein
MLKANFLSGNTNNIFSEEGKSQTFLKIDRKRFNLMHSMSAKILVVRATTLSAPTSGVPDI